MGFRHTVILMASTNSIVLQDNLISMIISGAPLSFSD